MAVVVQCYHCSNILELDEGFRGGVCRCSQCGSLLQVPKDSGPQTRKARPAAPGAVETPFRQPRPGTPMEDPGLSRGQFEPRKAARGDIDSAGNEGMEGRAPGGMNPTAVAALEQMSSGAFSVTSSDHRGPTDAPPPPTGREVETLKRNNRMLILVLSLAAVGLAVVVAIIVLQVLKNRPQPTASTPTNTLTTDLQSGTIGVVKGPNFIGIPLVSKKIVLSIDSASSMQESYDYVRKAVDRMIGTMSKDQQFTLVLWTEGSLRRIPENGWVTVGDAESVKQFRDEYANTSPLGASDAVECIKASLAIPGEKVQVVLVTAKATLKPELFAAVSGERKQEQRIDAVKLRSVDADSPLKKLAEAANGQYKFLDDDALRLILESK